MYTSNNNAFTSNKASNNDNGIYLLRSSNNVLFHNNLIDNTVQVLALADDPSECVNTLDDGYPSGGNYWSDYTGIDENGDGIGDTPYVIDENNQDNYPLMSPWGLVEEEEEEGIPFWMQWWLWVIVAVVLVALAGAVYFLKKRKPPTPTAPSLPTEGILQNTQNINPLNNYLPFLQSISKTDVSTKFY